MTPLPLVLLLTLVTAKRRTRSERVLPLLCDFFFPLEREGVGTTMTSRRDRVVRAKMVSRATMSDHRSWREFIWVSVSEGNRCTMCDTISP